MKNIVFITVFSCLYIINGCKKVDTPDGGTPVFSLMGNLDNAPFDWQAGVGERYMLADYTLVDNETKRVYRADLGLKNTPFDNEPEQIIVQFIQFEPDSTDTDINRTVKTGEFLYATSSGDSVVQGLQFSTVANGIGQFQVLVKIGNFLTDAQEGTITNIGNNYIGPATVSMFDELQRSSGQSLWVDLPAKTISGVTIEHAGDLLIAHVFGEKPIGFDWSGGPSANDSTFVVDSLFSQGVYSVTVDLGNKFVSNSIDFTKNSDIPCHVKMDLQPITIGGGSIKPNLENGRVIVQYIDKNGQVFSSDFIDQPSDSFFTVNSVEEYETNEAGNPTKKLDIDFSCEMTDTDRTSTKKLTNVKGVIAVGYPK